VVNESCSLLLHLFDMKKPNREKDDTFVKALAVALKKVKKKEKKYFSGPVRNYILNGFYDPLNQDASLVRIWQ
jgi:hypothetical protein